MGTENNLTKPDTNLVARLWQKELTLWGVAKASPDALASRLGWLDAVEWMDQHISELTTWSESIVSSGRFDHVILLGMGGSSLAPEVFSSVFGSQPGYPRLMVVDTTSPAQISAIDVDLGRSLFIVASKSGTTVETADLFSYFHSRLTELLDSPGDNLVAITDPDSGLHKMALQTGFAKVFLNPSDIGGRYSALSYFGLVPAALIGIDLLKLLTHTRSFKEITRDNSAENPVLQLTELMADCALKGNHKLELHLDRSLQSVAVWIEQLVAESTGKNGKGIIPVYDDPASQTNYQTEDRFSVYVSLAGGEGAKEDISNPENAVKLHWELDDRYDIGGEFLRWEMATALAASLMDINPFDQPNVEEAKQRTRSFVEGKETQSLTRVFECDHCTVYTKSIGSREIGTAKIGAVFDEFRAIANDASYLAILAYLPGFADVEKCLQQYRHALAQRFQLTTTLGYGPRYLHSTGQLHKGGPAVGCFIQITEQSIEEIAIPGRPYGFAGLHRAQADGDYSVLESKGRPVMRITLKGDRLTALDRLVMTL